MNLLYEQYWYIKESEINDSIYSDLNFVLGIEHYYLLVNSILAVENWSLAKRIPSRYRIRIWKINQKIRYIYLWERPFYWDY